MFCTDAASARPEACRDRRHAQRRCCWPEPGAGGGGDLPPPVRALRQSDITQAINRQRKLR
ncbi:hypothetical protein J4733_29110 [Klebsiella pneumoniae]|uniref:Uncharacterized protein n=1 Tax=Klebsiella pneumoniae TaxID=573 RepID=A0A939NRL8_KLEPN|nr:hypothetical protein [Klebsiella pneumoniae]